MSPTKPRPRRAAGFTLIELLIAVAVIGLLLAVALPSFLDSIRKGRRSEAFSALAALQQAQERHRGNNATYAATLTALNIAASTTAPGGYYALSIPANTATATGYELTADSTGSGANSSQSNDGACAKLGVQVNGGTVLYGSCSSSSCTFTWAASDACWKR